jgi:hypothetical protein
MTTKRKTIIVTEASQGIGPEELIAATLDQGTFARVAQDAELNCRLSGVLRAEIALNAKIV